MHPELNATGIGEKALQMRRLLCSVRLCAEHFACASDKGISGQIVGPRFGG